MMLDGADRLATAGNWAFVVGLVLSVAGIGVMLFASANRKRLLAHLHDRHPGPWQRLIDGKIVTAKGHFALFDWSQKAIRTGDAGLDAGLWRLRRIEQASEVLSVTGMLLLMFGSGFAELL